MKSQHEGALTPKLHRPEKDVGSKYISTSDISPIGQHDRQAEFHSSTQDEPKSPVSTLQRLCDQSQKWKGTLRFLLQFQMRPYSSLQRCARNPEVSVATPKDMRLPPRPGSPVPSTPERRVGLRACYWEGPSELPERRKIGRAHV